MVWRKWFVRGVVFTIVGVLACAAYLYRHWTNPAAVRRQVVDKLQTMLPGARISLDSAHMRLFGGIALRELRISRRDDPNQTNLLYVPDAVLYHDKEKLLDGALTLRKIELRQARLHLIRHDDGSWNLQGLTKPSQSQKTMPVLVVQRGTLIVEDRTLTQPTTVELRDVDLTLMNDRVSTVILRGTGRSELLGQVRLHGRWQPAANDLQISFNAEKMQVNSALVKRIAVVAPGLPLKDLFIRGSANVEGNVAFDPNQTPSFNYSVRWKIANTEIDHPQLPLPLQNVNAEVVLSNDLVHVTAFEAESGATRLYLDGAARLPDVHNNFAASLRVEKLQLDSGLFQRLPAFLQKADTAYTPRGPITIDAYCAKRNGKWVKTADGQPSHAVLQPTGIAVSCEFFPYPLERMRGKIKVDLATQRSEVDVVGYTGAQPVFVKGYWVGRGVEADGRLAIQAKDVPLDEKLLAALPQRFQKAARAFNAKGKCDLQSHVRHLPGQERFLNTYHAYFHGTSVKWEPFPYPLYNITGYLDIYPNHYEFRDFRATHGKTVVTLHGGSIRKGEPKEGTLVLKINAQNLAFDNDLKQALSRMAGLDKAWKVYRPSGRTNCTIRYERSFSQQDYAPPSDPVDVSVAVNGGSMTPTFLPYSLHHVKAGVRYNNHRLDIKTFRAWHNGTEVALEKGVVDIDPNGGYYAQLFNLHVNDLRCTDDFCKALPGDLSEGCASLQLHDPIRVQVRRIIVAQDAEPGSPPDIFWEGEVKLPKVKFKTGLEWKNVSGTIACVGRSKGDRLHGLTGNLLFDEATLLNQPFRNVHARFYMHKETPDVLNVDVRAPLFDGDVTGQVHIEFHSTLRYEMNLTASNIDLVKFGKHNLGADSQLKGLALARLHLAGKGDGIESMEGNGSIDVPRGRLKNLPLLLDLLKFIGFRGADRTMFEEAHARFGIHGSSVEIRDLQFMGNAVSLTGKGTFKLDGTKLNLDFYPSWARVEQLLPQALRPLPSGLTKNFLKIEMRGQISSNADDLKFYKKPIPILLDPLWNMRQRFLEVREAP